MGNEAVQERLRQAEKMLSQGAYREAHHNCIEVLKQAPETASAYYFLGVLAADHQNHAKACELYDKAIQFDPKDGRFQAWKGRSLIALNRREEAVACAEAAAEMADNTALTMDTIGVVFSRAGLHERAVPFYEQAAENMPGNSNLHYNHATALQFIGRMEEAKAAYERCLAIDPKEGRALAALAGLTKQTAEDNLIDRLEPAFEAMKGDPDKALQVGHALAKSYEDLGDVEQAMGWLARAKAGKKATVDPAASADKTLFDAAAELRDVAGHADKAPIFIVGLPRTGTTLVDRILSSTEPVETAGELTDFGLILKRATGTASPYVLDRETLEKGWDADLTAVGKDYITAARRIVPQAERFIDKMPLNFFYAALIHRALPEARIVCLRRHPADSVLSNYRQLFATGFSYYNYAYDLEQTARFYVMFDRLIGELRAKLPADRFLEVHYEDVVADLEGQARRLLDFCGLEWDPACLSFHENAAPVATASSVQVRQPLYSSSIGRWKKYAPHMEPALAVLRETGLLEE